MAATDFIHKSLIGAGSRDAVSNMLVGAGLGAAANTGLGIAQGDFGVIGNATSGALLGAAGGAAARHMGAKYGSGLMAAKAAKEEIGSGFQVGMMTRKVEEPAMDFWGKATDADNLKGFMPSSGTTKAGPKAGANTAGTGPQTPPPLPNPFPGQAAPKAPLPGIGSDFSGASASTAASRSGYSGNTANFTSNTPMPNRAAPTPIAASSDGLDGARAAIKRADEWKASEKARIKGEKQDKKSYDNWKKENATYGGG